MELLFIGVACTENAIKESNKKFYRNIDQVRPQQYFDLNYTIGLSSQCNVTAISLPPVASFPRSKCVFYKRNKEKVNENLTIKYITLLNIIGIKTLIIMISVLISTLLFCIKNINKDSKIVMGSILFYTALPAILCARIFHKKIFVTVPDLPSYMDSYAIQNKKIKALFNKISIKLNRMIENGFDGYILLTEKMNEVLNLKKKPSIVIEGMVNFDDFKFINDNKIKTKKIIMYAGTLHEKFGIKKLVESFKLCKTTNCELWIFGIGDYLEEIKREMKSNKGIIYKGSVSRSEILEYETKATLLVNPRPTNEDFTKYSFPSKTIEYMASGTPFLTTKLEGIPKEYFDYIFTFESEDIKVMANNMDHILSMPNSTLNKIGCRAKDFVIKNKNHIAQAKKIISFIENVN